LLGWCRTWMWMPFAWFFNFLCSEPDILSSIGKKWTPAKINISSLYFPKICTIFLHFFYNLCVLVKTSYAEWFFSSPLYILYSCLNINLLFLAMPLFVFFKFEVLIDATNSSLISQKMRSEDTFLSVPSGVNVTLTWVKSRINVNISVRAVLGMWYPGECEPTRQ